MVDGSSISKMNITLASSADSHGPATMRRSGGRLSGLVPTLRLPKKVTASSISSGLMSPSQTSLRNRGMDLSPVFALRGVQRDDRSLGKGDPLSYARTEISDFPEEGVGEPRPGGYAPKDRWIMNHIQAVTTPWRAGSTAPPRAIRPARS